MTKIQIGFSKKNDLIVNGKNDIIKFTNKHMAAENLHHYRRDCIYIVETYVACSLKLPKDCRLYVLLNLVPICVMNSDV